jgi:protein-tyrosine phosphatase
VQQEKEIKILMVCLGNICRSPMAQGILRKKIEESGLKVTVDSAGTGGWHAGEPADRRAVKTAKKFGIDISKLAARKFSAADFDAFDFIFVMDRENLREVLKLVRSEKDAEKVKLLLNAENPECNKDVPDPWYGGEEGFTDVFLMIEKACDAVLKSLSTVRR